MALLFIFPRVSLSSSKYPSYTPYNPDILLGTMTVEFNMTYSRLKKQPSLYYFSNYHTNVLDKGGQVSLLTPSENEEIKASQHPLSTTVLCAT